MIRDQHFLTGPPGNCECGDALNGAWTHVELGQGLCVPREPEPYTVPGISGYVYQQPPPPYVLAWTTEGYAVYLGHLSIARRPSALARWDVETEDWVE